MGTAITISDKKRPARQKNHLTIGALIFPRMDQIDFTGPFEVLSRIPDSTIHVIAKTKSQVCDIQGLILTPEMSIAEAPEFDVLLVPGGYGQQQLMDDEEVLSLIRSHSAAGRLVFSVCTGALLCGAAGVLRGRQATTHWSAWGTCCLVTGPHLFDRASSWMATWSPLPALPLDSMPRWLSRRCCVGTQSPRKFN